MVSNVSAVMYVSGGEHYFKDNVTSVLDPVGGVRPGNGTIYDSLTFENPLNHPWVKFMFILLFCLVFVVCGVGNSLVLYTIARNKRMRTHTNFFLANLAVADLSVGLVCILPKLIQYLSLSWFLGQAMCKIYYFAHSLTYTASILLLTAIAIERYIAVLYPLRSKCLVTQSRLVLAQVFIWVLSFAYNCPELSMFNLFTITINNETTVFCFPTNPYTNMRNYYTTNFLLWYILPLTIMVSMYTRVAITLWKSSKLSSHSTQGFQMRSISQRDTRTLQETVVCYDGSLTDESHRPSQHSPVLADATKQTRNNNNAKVFTSCLRAGSSPRHEPEKSGILEDEGATCTTPTEKFSCRSSWSSRSRSSRSRSQPCQFPRRYIACDFTSEADVTSSEEYDMISKDGSTRPRVQCRVYQVSSHRVLNSRRRVIKLLIVILLTFAVCVLPYHLKLLLLHWEIYPTDSSNMDFMSPLAFIMLYVNSAVNPVLYWVFSDTFRRSFRDSCRRNCVRSCCAK
ncbi:trissin receptor-like [Physella acuta]|uniref:trissin receptor-like n=1 Tax=Physella acuta TaxID=109671 RepID=UPI0027DACB13|nr:trissin receptor-like [Physella acuta]